LLTRYFIYLFHLFILFILFVLFIYLFIYLFILFAYFCYGCTYRLCFSFSRLFVKVVCGANRIGQSSEQRQHLDTYVRWP